MAASLTSELAAWGASVRWSSLPVTVREATVCRLVDSIGLMLAGSATAAGQAVRDYATSTGGTPEATLLGSGERLPAASVALVHGTWAHVHDYDDTEPESVIHPTSPVAAAVLAVGETSGSSPEEVLAAAAVGIEVMCRLGAPAGRRFHHRGFHATGLAGPIAVALAASTITGSPTDVAVSAMGLAGSMSSGLLAFLTDGSWSKRLHPGWAAHGGITASALAARGFTGPAAVLEDRYGTYAAFLHGEVVDHAAVVGDLGTTWRSLPAHFKRFPCAHVIQPFVDAVLEGGIRAGDVAEIVLRLPAWQVPIVCEPWDTKVRPATEYQARTSLPFAVAAAVVDGDVGIDTFDDAKLRRPEMDAALERIRYEAADDLDGFDAVVDVRRHDGTTTVLRPPPSEPPITEIVRAKLGRTAGRVVDAAVVAVLRSALDGADSQTAFDPVALVRRCRVDREEDNRAGGVHAQR